MPRLLSLVSLAAALLALGGCCRDTIREMASLKDGIAPRAQERSAKAAPRRESKSAEVGRSDDDEAIETGSVNAQPDCQGQHLAYQATKEYLKNFGPKPPDQPGERGPCNPNQQ
jgi:hypothetical protein